MSVVVLDIGNSIVKAKTATKEVAFPHALQPITRADFDRVKTRATAEQMGLDYLVINGSCYAVGESAERHGVLSLRSGASRYRRDYYGLLTAATLARLYPHASVEVWVFGSHPPVDIDYRGDLMDAAFGTWEVEVQGQKRQYTVSYVNTYEEPMGGLMNVLLSKDGRHYNRPEINDGTALVVDIGGHTTDWLAVREGGAVDYNSADGIKIGVGDIIRDFERSFKTRYRDAVKDATALPPHRVREAVRTGVFRGRGREYPCEAEVDEAVNKLLNQFAAGYQAMTGGGIMWDSVILTGGGSGLLYDRLLPILDHEQVIMADDFESIHLANVRGGMKLWRLCEAEGIV